MWDIFRVSAEGYFSLRKITLILMAGFMASASLVLVGNSPSAYAEPATWEGESVVYNGQTFTKMSNPPALPGVGNSDQFGLYEYKKDDTTSLIVAIKKGSDPTKDIADAKLYTYDYDGTSYTLRGPPGGETITISAKTDTDKPKT